MPSLVQTFFVSPSAGKLAKGAYRPQQKSAATPLDIIDIRLDTVEASLKEDIHSLFHPKEGLRKLPTLLLYDERGLQLFEKVGLPPSMVPG
jgi:hypothetical protein